MDAAAPGLLLAQGIGRIGNWWNQELYGKPTDLPWGLKIDAGTTGRSQYFAAATFHPTFLYELIWDLVGVGRADLGRPALPDPAARRSSRSTSPGTRFGRFFEELLRIDPSHHIAGLRLNAWVSIILFVGSTALFVW